MKFSLSYLTLFFLAITFLPNNAQASTAASLWGDMRVTEFLKLSMQELEERSGYKIKRGEKIPLRVVKSKMRKAARKNPDITVAEFFATQKSAGSIVLWILLGGLLLCFFLFLMLFTDEN